MTTFLLVMVTLLVILSHFLLYRYGYRLAVKHDLLVDALQMEAKYLRAQVDNLHERQVLSNLLLDKARNAVAELPAKVNAHHKELKLVTDALLELDGKCRRHPCSSQVMDQLNERVDVLQRIVERAADDAQKARWTCEALADNRDAQQ